MWISHKGSLIVGMMDKQWELKHGEVITEFKYTEWWKNSKIKNGIWFYENLKDYNFKASESLIGFTVTLIIQDKMSNNQSLNSGNKHSLFIQGLTLKKLQQ